MIKQCVKKTNKKTPSTMWWTVSLLVKPREVRKHTLTHTPSLVTVTHHSSSRQFCTCVFPRTNSNPQREALWVSLHLCRGCVSVQHMVSGCNLRPGAVFVKAMVSHGFRDDLSIFKCYLLWNKTRSHALMPSLAIFGVMEVDDTQVQASCVTFCYSFHKGKVEPRLVHLCFCELWLRRLNN